MSGHSKKELADYFGIGHQSMINKLNRDTLTAKDLIKIADFVGADLAFIFPDGNKIVLNPEEPENTGKD